MTAKSIFWTMYLIGGLFLVLAPYIGTAISAILFVVAATVIYLICFAGGTHNP